MSSALSTAKGFLAAFAAKDLEKLPTFIGESFRFKGPMMEFDDAGVFSETMKGMAQGWQCEHNFLREVEQGNDAILVYDLVMTAPISQTVTMFEWYRVEEGKITDIRLMFDTAAMKMP